MIQTKINIYQLSNKKQENFPIIEDFQLLSAFLELVEFHWLILNVPHNLKETKAVSG